MQTSNRVLGAAEVRGHETSGENHVARRRGVSAPYGISDAGQNRWLESRRRPDGLRVNFMALTRPSQNGCTASPWKPPERWKLKKVVALSSTSIDTVTTLCSAKPSLKKTDPRSLGWQTIGLNSCTLEHRILLLIALHGNR